MSSLSAAQADGYYVPPEYYSSGQYKKKSINQFAGSKGHNQYLQRGIVRFELPYDGFCDKCGAHVGKGTRFNAAKTKAGAYLTSTIYEFRMKCRICAEAEFVILTNPKEQSFDYVSGIHKQVHESESSRECTLKKTSVDIGDRYLGSNDRGSLAYIEGVAHGKRKAETERDDLEALMHVKEKTFGQDMVRNSALREVFRHERRKKRARLTEGAKRGWAEGMEVLSDEHMGDVIAAKSAIFSDSKVKESVTWRKLRTSSMFDKAAKIHGPDHVPIKDDPSPDPVPSEKETSQTIQEESMSLPKGTTKKKKKLIISIPGAKLNVSDTGGASSFENTFAVYGSDSD
jgi:hypothetical protein